MERLPTGHPPQDAPRLLAAEWVLPVSSEPIRDGVVALEGPRIAWVGPRRELPSRFLRAPLRAFPRSLLLPGWINAHSHLNLTAALGLVPGSADRFTDWVRRVIRLQEGWPPSVVRQSVVAGLDLLGSTGTTTVAHVATLPDLEPFLEHPMRSVVFHEPIGFPASRATALLEQAEAWLDAAESRLREEGSARVRVGLAPHAPYSASPELIQGAAALAERRGVPFSIHVAETRSEVEFLRTGGGPFRELLEERGAWDPGWTPPGVSPVRYAAELGILSLPRAGLAVHCNYLEPGDLRFLAEGSLVPVWCPGSHRFFGHPLHPAADLLASGVRVALATDSLASNAGLSMLRELRLAAESMPEVDRRAWLRGATLDAATGLGLEGVTGSLEPGRAADVQVLEGVQEETTDPLAALFTANLRVRTVLVDGVEMKIR